MNFSHAPGIFYNFQDTPGTPDGTGVAGTLSTVSNSAISAHNLQAGYGTGSANGTWLLAVTKTSGGTAVPGHYVIRSTDDGQTWSDVITVSSTINAPAGNFAAQSLVYGAGRWIWTAWYVVFVSDDDGLTWTRDTALDVIAGGALQTAQWAVRYANGAWVAVNAMRTTTVNRLTDIAATSVDGITWTRRTLPTAQSYGAMSYDPIRNRWLVGCISTGTTTTVTATTMLIESYDNGVTWAAAGVNTLAVQPYSLTYFNNKFIAIISGTSNPFVADYHSHSWVLTIGAFGVSTDPKNVYGVKQPVSVNGVLLIPAVTTANTTLRYTADGVNYDNCTFLTGSQSAIRWSAGVSNDTNTKALLFSSTLPLQCLCVSA